MEGGYFYIHAIPVSALSLAASQPLRLTRARASAQHLSTPPTPPQATTRILPGTRHLGGIGITRRHGLSKFAYDACGIAASALSPGFASSTDAPRGCPRSHPRLSLCRCLPVCRRDLQVVLVPDEALGALKLWKRSWGERAAQLRGQRLRFRWRGSASRLGFGSRVWLWEPSMH